MQSTSPSNMLLTALHDQLISGLHHLLLDITGLKGNLVLVIQSFCMIVTNKIKDA